LKPTEEIKDDYEAKGPEETVEMKNVKERLHDEVAHAPPDSHN
jgi:hypothetical protein